VRTDNTLDLPPMTAALTSEPMQGQP